MKYAIKNNVLERYELENDESTIIIPKGVERIECEFKNVKDIVSIEIPDSVSSIDFVSGDFYKIENVYITSLKAWVDIWFEPFINVSGVDVCYTNPLNNGANLILNGKKVENLVIPDGSKKVNCFAFTGCSSIKNVVLPESLEEISAVSFANCQNLESITFNENIRKVGRWAFDECNKLNKVMITNLDAWKEIQFDYDYTDTAIFTSNPLDNKDACLYLNGKVLDNTQEIYNYSHEYYKKTDEVFLSYSSMMKLKETNPEEYYKMLDEDIIEI